MSYVLTRCDSLNMSCEYLYRRDEQPFLASLGRNRAASWCNWLLSIPKKNNPAIDESGKYCSIDQNDKNVWYLAGTFGNDVSVKRKCIIPADKAIFFPILEKEDSLAEDSDLKTDSDLIKRSKNATDKVLHMEATIDGHTLEDLKNYRVQSEVFNLTFPEDNVYDVRPGVTRSVCDGYWLFIKPLQIGKHYMYFKGENLLAEPITTAHMIKSETYHNGIESIINKSKFRLEVLYELTVRNKGKG